VKDGRGNAVLHTSVGDEGVGGVPKQRGCLRTIALILVHGSRAKRISCEGQAAMRHPRVTATLLGLSCFRYYQARRGGLSRRAARAAERWCLGLTHGTSGPCRGHVRYVQAPSLCWLSQAERRLTPSGESATACDDNWRNGCVGACCDGRRAGRVTATLLSSSRCCCCLARHGGLG